MANYNPIYENIEGYNLKNLNEEERKKIASKGGKASALKRQQVKKNRAKCTALMQIAMMVYSIANMDYERLYEELFKEEAPKEPTEATEQKIYDKFEEIQQGIK